MTNSDPATPATATGNPGQEVRARREPVPPVRVDPDEDRLEEEREPLEGEPEPEHVPEVLYPHRPQQPQLKDRIVPVTTPTANSASMIRDHRRASVR